MIFSVYFSGIVETSVAKHITNSISYLSETSLTLSRASSTVVLSEYTIVVKLSI